MSFITEEIIQKANQIVELCETRDATKIARQLGIIVLPRPFVKQRGAYVIIERNRFALVKEDLPPPLYNAVLLHEIGHDVIHRREAILAGGFREFNLFGLREDRMECQADLFASQVALPDDEVLEYIENGYDLYQIARAMNTNYNLVALKIDTLISQGHRLRPMEHRNDFLNDDIDDCFYD